MLKMCLKKLNDAKINFLINLQHFQPSQFSTTAHIGQWLIVHTFIFLNKYWPHVVPLLCDAVRNVLHQAKKES